MQAVSIRTTQNVQLEYPLAGVADRVLAYIIDLFIVVSFFLIVQLFLMTMNAGLGMIGNLLIGIVAYLYRFVMEVFFNGQTVGKMALSIKVVKLDGSTPSIAAYFLRWLLELIDFTITGLAVILIILTKNGQRLGDLLAGTTVVKIKKISATNMQNKVLMDPVDEDYQPVFAEAANLTDEEVRLIKSSLKAFREDAIAKPITILEDKLKEKYNISSELTTVKFLYTLLRDHTYYVSK
ncbi:RDD family protein [Roseivirga pacifica]|uniref:RDD family protein n=1 Tax=Roseivirga pacifica TaxID=1267423 RepID=UPI002095E642|nr:RDD family protein [Roseivirga pacifica]MCO6358818.1 hypothetical protein [Roseivirga pacifica]MCO6365546.1 hypothetical protein [Roseivirga pacifica]MCO6371724.1 hypothetical protein [Roseivirga pacifica]MCO6376165.1 hypothetical protein [Roseivirga pacifica]MCO6379102.1 hypothetical protein [Roseivirga pacifica]